MKQDLELPVRGAPRPVSKGLFAQPFFEPFAFKRTKHEAGSTLPGPCDGARTIGVVETGWAYRFRILSDGRRFVTRFFMAGDCLGLQPLDTDSLDRFVTTLTAVRLAHYASFNILQALADDDDVARDVLSAAALHERFTDEQLCMLGRHTAQERVAWLAATLFSRAHARGLTELDTLKVPITQLLIADATGLSLVHVNKTIAKLARDGIIRWSRNELRILNATALDALLRHDDREIHKVPVVESTV